MIDDILTPLTGSNPSSLVGLENPDAFKFITNSDTLDIGGFRIRWVFHVVPVFVIKYGPNDWHFSHVPSLRATRDLLFENGPIFIIAIMVLLFILPSSTHTHTRSFRQRVIYTKKENVYQANGGYTFFIPVEEGFKVC